MGGKTDERPARTTICLPRRDRCEGCCLFVLAVRQSVGDHHVVAWPEPRHDGGEVLDCRRGHAIDSGNGCPTLEEPTCRCLLVARIGTDYLSVDAEQLLDDHGTRPETGIEAEAAVRNELCDLLGIPHHLQVDLTFLGRVRPPEALLTTQDPDVVVAAAERELHHIEVRPAHRHEEELAGGVVLDDVVGEVVELEPRPNRGGRSRCIRPMVHPNHVADECNEGNRYADESEWPTPPTVTPRRQTDHVVERHRTREPVDVLHVTRPRVRWGCGYDRELRVVVEHSEADPHRSVGMDRCGSSRAARRDRRGQACQGDGHLHTAGVGKVSRAATVAPPTC